MVTRERIQLTRLSDVKALAADYDFHPSRALGQNFLIDGNILDILLDTADVRAGDKVLEIGPGMGVVTSALLDRGVAVTAIEKDRRLVSLLGEMFGDNPQFELIEGDALSLSVSLVQEKGLTSLVSNLPYNPGSRILMDLICADSPPERLTVTVQLEVAERMVAKPGTKAYGLMGIWCQLHCDVKLVKVVSPSCFWPRPAIRSAIVTMKRRRKPLMAADAYARFYALTRYAFQHRRKQLVPLLTKAPASLSLDVAGCRERLASAGLAETVRPENVPVAVWCELAR
jgi:16S rRNA (adenine1518-N6/adenine1519-N6)-dimethyltransferase